MLLFVCKVLASIALFAPSDASSISNMSFMADLKESAVKLGHIKSLIKAEQKDMKSITSSKDLSFPYRVISELFEAIQNADSPVQPGELAMYMTASKSVVDTLVESLRSRRVLPESTASFLDKIGSLREGLNELSVRLNTYAFDYEEANESDFEDVHSEGDELSFSRRTTTTSTTSTPPPPAAPAMISIYKPKSAPQRKNKPSVPHILV